MSKQEKLSELEQYKDVLTIKGFLERLDKINNEKP